MVYNVGAMAQNGFNWRRMAFAGACAVSAVQHGVSKNKAKAAKAATVAEAQGGGVEEAEATEAINAAVAHRQQLDELLVTAIEGLSTRISKLESGAGDRPRQEISGEEDDRVGGRSGTFTNRYGQSKVIVRAGAVSFPVPPNGTIRQIVPPGAVVWGEVELVDEDGLPTGQRIALIDGQGVQKVGNNFTFYNPYQK